MILTQFKTDIEIRAELNKYGVKYFMLRSSQEPLLTIKNGLFKVKHVTHYRLDAGTFGTMGVGLGFAIAAAAVEKSSSGEGQRIVCVEGDSAFGFSGMEVETMCRWARNFYITLTPTTVLSLNSL